MEDPAYGGFQLAIDTAPALAIAFRQGDSFDFILLFMSADWADRHILGDCRPAAANLFGQSVF